jgi:hypothetical protein
MTTEPSASTTAEWAAELFGVIYEPGDIVEIRPLIPGEEEPRAGRRWLQASDIGGGGIADWMHAANDDGHCIYFGANPRSRRGGGKTEDVLLARCLFADFDDGVEVEDALAHIELAGKPWPSAIVHSGNGVHLWWRLAEPITDMEAWTRCQKKLAGDIGSDSVVSDAPRLMRVPGYVNTKYEHKPTCRLDETSGEVFDVRDILPGGIPPKPLEFRTDSEPVEPGSMSRQTRRFLDEGYVFAKGGRRCTAFTAACDLKARGWKLADAQCEIMKAVPKLGLAPKEAADIPRQIASAFSRDRTPCRGGEAVALQQVAAPTNTQWTPFPVELMPSAVRDYVKQTAEGMACDPTLVAVPMLAGLAAAIGNTRTIMLNDDWVEPSILWVAVVADSGSLKTPASRKALRFITQQESEIEQRNAAARDEYDEELIIHETRMAAWKQQARRSADNAGAPPPKPAKPPRAAYVVSDTTIEAVVGILADNPRGVLLERDELAGWLAGFDKYKSGGAGRVSSEVGHWLSMHNAGTLRLDRKSTGRTFVERASLSITGGIQPDTLVQAIGQEHVANGLLARFLLAAPPRRPKRFTTATADFAAVESARQLFATLYGLSMPEDGPKSLRLSRDGLDAWEVFFRRHADRQMEAKGVEASMLAKIEAAAARLALIHHVCRQAGDEPTLGHDVDAQSVNVGIALAEWFADEWQRVYDSTVGGTPSRDHDAELLAWIEAQGGKVAVRDIGQRLRRYRDADLLERTITATVHAGRLESFTVKNEHGGPHAHWVRLVADKPKPK